MLITASRSVLLLVDLQTKLVPAIDGASACVARCQQLLTAARRLNVPVLATEHCPARVGVTIASLRDRLDPADIVEKRHFDGAAEKALLQALYGLGRASIIVAGMEAHVCVLQTVLGLKAKGYDPVVVADAIGSRRPLSRNLAVERMRHHGVDVVDTEMVIFEWLGVGDSEAFRELLPMIKSGSVV